MSFFPLTRSRHRLYCLQKDGLQKDFAAQMEKLKKSQAPIKLELSGPLVDRISHSLSVVAGFIEAVFLSLTEIVLALKDAAVRRLRGP